MLSQRFRPELTAGWEGVRVGGRVVRAGWPLAGVSCAGVSCVGVAGPATGPARTCAGQQFPRFGAAGALVAPSPPCVPECGKHCWEVPGATDSAAGLRIIDRLGKSLPVWEIPAGLQRRDFPNRQQKQTVTRTLSCLGAGPGSAAPKSPSSPTGAHHAYPSTPSHASRQGCRWVSPHQAYRGLGTSAPLPLSPVHSAVSVAWKDRTRHLVHYDRPGQRVEASTRSVLGNRCQFGKSLPVCSGRDFPNRQQIPKTAAETPRETFSCRG